jgi:iron complex outermembrane recepter protein
MSTRTFVTRTITRPHLPHLSRIARLTLLAISAVSTSALAQSTTPSSTPSGKQDAQTEKSESIVVTGTRFSDRLIAESLVPIDVISVNDLSVGGYTDLQRMLKARVPAFSLPNSNGAGTVDFVSAPTLRGLGIGQMLVLVNGKRRHSTGDISTGQQIGRGDSGYDFNAIPVAALSRVEVLRDGASAQYGSDAIAGVVNLVLNRATGGSIDAMAGTTKIGDGDFQHLSAGYGFALPSGVLRATVFRNANRATNRAGLDTRQQYFGNNGLTLPSPNFGSGIGLTPANGTLDPREATIDRNTFKFGSPAYINQGFFLNADNRISEAATLYAFGGYNDLKGESPGFFRRAGQDETVRAIHPNGYLPQGPYDITNQSLAVGVRGAGANDWTWDASTVYGGNRIENRYTNTNNPSLGNQSPTEFYRGGTEYSQWTTNVDLTKRIAMGANPLKLAFGVEHRREQYRILVGEPLSYANGGVAIIGGPNNGRPAPVGVQPASGYRPSDATDQTRDSRAVYLDAEREMLPGITASIAARHEHYSDFGSSNTYKLAARAELTRALSLRASVGTGFRAPHLAQSWFANTTNTVVNGVLVSSRLLAVSDPVARVLGAAPLKPERSTNQSIGVVYDQGALSLSVDAYQIKVRDRIALSSNFTGAAVTTLLANAGFPNITSASFLTNAVDTTTRGAEVTLRHLQSLGTYGKLTTTFGAMHNKSTFDRIARAPAQLAAIGVTTPLFDLTQQVRFTTSQPKDKFTLAFDWQWDKFSVNLTGIRYGQYEAVAFANITPARAAVVSQGYRVRTAPTDPASANVQAVQQFDAKLITDIEFSYRLTKNLTLSAGANNLFDVYPTRNLPSTAASVAAGTNGADNFGTLLYNYASPHDWNGATYFAKLNWRF